MWMVENKGDDEYERHEAKSTEVGITDTDELIELLDCDTSYTDYTAEFVSLR